MRPIIAAALAIILATPALAQFTPKERNLFDIGRLAVAGAASYDWHAGDGVTPQPAFRKEFAAGATAAYILTEHVSASAAAMYMSPGSIMCPWSSGRFVMCSLST